MFNLLQDAPFISSTMMKHRLGYLDKIVHWYDRKEGTTDEIGRKELTNADKKSQFETRLLAFEQYIVDKVNSTNINN